MERSHQAGDGREGAAVVAMRDPSLQRRGHSQRQGRSDDREDVVLREVRELKDRAVEVARNLSSGARAAGEQVMRQAADVTRAVTEGVREEAERLFEEQKGRLGSSAKRWGKSIKQGAHALRAVKAEGAADVVDQAAERVGGLSDYLEEQDLSGLLADAEDVARRHPAVVMGTLFVTGLLAARFVKASAARGERRNAGDKGRTGRAGR